MQNAQYGQQPEQQPGQQPVACQCGLQQMWRDTVAEAAASCHHTDPERAREIKVQLGYLIDAMHQQVPIQDFFKKPLEQLAQEYSKAVLYGESRLAAGRDENRAVMIGFLRYATLAIQYLQVHHISEGTPPTRQVEQVEPPRSDGVETPVAKMESRESMESRERGTGAR